MRPCDCESIQETLDNLTEQGISFNGWNMVVKPNSVILSNGTATIKVPMITFKKFSEWFLEDQNDTRRIQQKNTGTKQ